MSTRRTRRHPPRPAPKPLTPPAIDRLVGWSLERLAAESGVDRVQALRVLREAVDRGEVARIECAGRVLWANVGGGRIPEVAR